MALRGKGRFRSVLGKRRGVGGLVADHHKISGHGGYSVEVRGFDAERPRSANRA
jgi:hypothetical protein